jgi:hypothetical protein
MIINNKTNFYLYSGTIGWTGNKELDAIYPEDLPEEWRLAFYNTLFRCVYLPVDIWTKLTELETDALLDEVQDGFRFILESPKKYDPIYNNIINKLQYKYVMEDEVKIHWLVPETSMRELAKIMQSAINSGYPLYLISRETDMSLLRQVNELMEVLGA